MTCSTNDSFDLSFSVSNVGDMSAHHITDALPGRPVYAVFFRAASHRALPRFCCPNCGKILKRGATGKLNTTQKHTETTRSAASWFPHQTDGYEKATAITILKHEMHTTKLCTPLNDLSRFPVCQRTQECLKKVHVQMPPRVPCPLTQPWRGNHKTRPWRRHAAT